MSGSMNVTFSRRRYVSVFLAVCERGRLASSSSSREPKSTANITADMFSVAVYYQTSVKDAHKKINRENLKFGLKFSVRAPIT